MLASDIIRRVRSSMGDAAGVISADADLIDLINDAQLEINVETRSLLATSPVNLVAGTNEYLLPADFVAVVDLFFPINGANQYITAASRQWVDGRDPYRANTTSNRGTPRYFYTEGLSLGIWPTPDAVYAGSLRYVKMPTAIAVAADALTLPAWTQPLISRMVFALMKEKDEDFEAAQAIKNEVFTKLHSMKARIEGAAFTHYQVVREVDEEMFVNE